ncbi:MAG: class I SAM-dependent methyltransferase [Bacteroidota bacterium]
MKTNRNEIIDLHNTDLYLYFYEDFIDTARTTKECKLIIEECELEPNAKILDLACGHGRHSIRFAENGFAVTGIDLNTDFIELAKKNAKEQNLDVEFTVDNIVNINYSQQFDGIILLYNSFGFLDKQDGETLIKNISKALKPNGKIFLDIRNRDRAIKDLSDCHVMEKGKDLMIDRLSYDPKKGTTTNNRIYVKDGVRYDTPFTMQLYNYSELQQLLAKYDLRIKKVYGHWDKHPFDAGSKRIIAVIEKE